MEEIEIKINNIKSELIELRKKIYHSDNYEIREEYDKKLKKYYKLYEELDKIKDLEFVKTNDCYTSDEEIDLYLFDYDINLGSRFCKIYLHNKPILVGEINYRGKMKCFPFGNISYCIDKKFQGNNYALKALKLITDKIYEDGIDKVFISAHDDNIPSLKTIEKFGGILIEKISHICSYECDLNKIKNLNKDVINKR